MKEQPKDLFEWANQKQDQKPENADALSQEKSEKPKFVYASKDDGYDFGSPQGDLQGRFIGKKFEQKIDFEPESIQISEPIRIPKSPEEIQAEDESIDREVEAHQFEEEQTRDMTPEEISEWIKGNQAA